jgi:hypothetical protein
MQIRFERWSILSTLAPKLQQHIIFP